jgi:NAD(P)-dependent dehydrogenase (short-subunit alcohol dehydrogenase family)
LKEKGAGVIELDVTDSIENLHKIAAKAIDIYGRIDVLVNNAGMCKAPQAV